MIQRIIWALVVILLIASCKPKANNIRTLTADGTWCWFSDPRAIHLHGNDKGILTGWITEDGSLETAIIKEDGTIKMQHLVCQLEKDDHANPAFVEVGANNHLVFYTKHFDEFVRYHKPSLNEEEIYGKALLHDPFDAEELNKFPLRRTTYANPYFLENEDKIYCFGRWTGFKPNMMISEDGGETFSKSKVLITNYPFDGENRPYAKYFSNGKSRIHIVFTDGHPRNEPTNSVYYAYYENDAFWRIDGSKICTVNELPFTPQDASIVYDAKIEQGKSWVFDIASDKEDNPVILYAKYPNDLQHEFYNTKYNGTRWVETKLCDSGKWFPQTPEGEIEREPNYSGGLTLDPANVNTVFTSEQINGIFEIVRYNLNDAGEINSRTEITKSSSQDNVRPFVARNWKKGDKKTLLWMQNEKYVHYTDYKCSVNYVAFD